MTPACPPVSQLESRLHGKLSVADAATLDAHVHGCAVCQQAVAGLSATLMARRPPPPADLAPTLHKSPDGIPLACLAGAGLFPKDDLANASGTLARCVALIQKDDQLSAAQRTGLTEKYGARAVALLRQAAENGFREVEMLKHAPLLTPVRERADFQKLLAELQQP